MVDYSSFLELPLDRELHTLRPSAPTHKHPLRVLVTNAGEKIAYNLIYELCSGNVFGPNQQIILHLISSRGTMHYKAIVLELEECAFSVYKDAVVSSDPAVAYGKVNVVIVIGTFEQLPGRMKASTLVYQIVKSRKVLEHVKEYAHPDAKIIFTGPSTKALTMMLTTLKKCMPTFPFENVSCVTHLDVVIAKAHLAAKLKTTTDKIKNLIVWSATYPDIHNATVRMYPINDFGAFEMVDVSVSQALQDDVWFYTTFGQSIFRRVISPDLVKYGKAVAQSTAQHLKFLFRGSEITDEYVSMSVVTPTENPYDVPPDYGFSFPVETKRGKWKIVEGLEFDVPTQLNILRVMFNLTCRSSNTASRVLKVFLEYENVENEDSNAKFFNNEIIESEHFVSNYFVVPNLAEWGEPIQKEMNRPLVKSILWTDETGERLSLKAGFRSYTNFSSDMLQLEPGKFKKSHAAPHEDGSSIFVQKGRILKETRKTTQNEK